MPETLTASLNFVNPALIAFMPRQVLLLKPEMKGSKIQKDNINKDKKTTKALLLDSVAQYLERNGFSKTLKKFRSEAGIEKEDFRSSFDLEEIYCKSLETRYEKTSFALSYFIKAFK
ncbi:uncharacterized protein LOC110825320 [Carica papaya]|uniref:uncharacterized protein LOC110825320 n=1 Tax=Carica papaya TaxID=3649 RepID=UPI000B8CFC7A|nr:uncharacterized protein LOC110825320 [Carica papaya]